MPNVSRSRNRGAAGPGARPRAVSRAPRGGVDRRAASDGAGAPRRLRARRSRRRHRPAKRSRSHYFNRPIVVLKARVLGRSPMERAAGAERALDELAAQRITGPVDVATIRWRRAHQRWIQRLSGGDGSRHRQPVGGNSRGRSGPDRGALATGARRGGRRRVRPVRCFAPRRWRSGAGSRAGWRCGRSAGRTGSSTRSLIAAAERTVAKTEPRRSATCCGRRASRLRAPARDDAMVAPRPRGGLCRRWRSSSDGFRTPGPGASRCAGSSGDGARTWVWDAEALPGLFTVAFILLITRFLSG